jgi:hypothetical protein
MWVTYEGRIGIINAFSEQSVEGEPSVEIAEFHSVQEDGTTGFILGIPSSALAQALRAEIPEVRRPSEEIAQKYGYK